MVNHYFEEDDTVRNVPLFYVNSTKVAALDIAHAYLATFGDERSIGWLIQRYQETKVAGMLQPAIAYRYYQLLYLAGILQDGPTWLDSTIP